MLTTMFRFLAAAAMCLPLALQADDKLPVPQELARTTAANLGTVSAMLTKTQKAVAAVIEERTDAIVELNRSTGIAQQGISREIAVLSSTRGEALAALYKAMLQQGEQAAQAPALLDASDAALRKDIAAGTVLSKLSTDKLDEAAKKLSTIATEQTPAERLRQTIAFFQHTKAATEKLHEEAAKQKEKADLDTDTVKTRVKVEDPADADKKKAVPKPN